MPDVHDALNTPSTNVHDALNTPSTNVHDALNTPRVYDALNTDN